MIQQKSEYFDENGHYIHAKGYHLFHGHVNRNKYFTPVIEQPVTQKSDIEMTLCIACLADGGKSAVLAADDMVCHTISQDILYKVCSRETKKIKQETSNIYILIAGDDDKYAEVIKGADIIEGQSPKTVAYNINASLYRCNMEHKETQVLKPIGLTWAKLMALPAGFLEVLQSSLTNSTIGCDFIVAGIDDETKLINIFHVKSDGSIYDRSKEGLGIIGIGYPLAKVSFLQSNYKKELNLEEVKVMVRNAMKAGENSPYVDMATHYWAGGFSNGYLEKAENERKLKEFIDGKFWQGIYYSNEDKSPTALNARNIFSQISIGDKFLIKGLGGRYDLVVHFVGEVIGIDKTTHRLDLNKEKVTLYNGKAPRGEGAGNWFDTLLEVKRPEDIKMLF